MTRNIFGVANGASIPISDACPLKSSIITISKRRGPPLLVCRKCLRRVDDGKAIKRALKSELKRRSVAQGVKKPRVVMTNCFGICPKHAVVVASGKTLARGEYLLLADGDAADAVNVLIAGGSNQR